MRSASSISCLMPISQTHPMVLKNKGDLLKAAHLRPSRLKHAPAQNLIASKEPMLSNDLVDILLAEGRNELADDVQLTIISDFLPHGIELSSILRPKELTLGRVLKEVLDLKAQIVLNTPPQLADHRFKDLHWELNAPNLMVADEPHGAFLKPHRELMGALIVRLPLMETVARLMQKLSEAHLPHHAFLKEISNLSLTVPDRMQQVLIGLSGLKHVIAPSVIRLHGALNASLNLLIRIRHAHRTEESHAES